MNETLAGYAARLETLARSQGLDYYPVVFEEVSDSFMMEVAVYGLPIRMPHWSFGLRYIYQLVQHRMGHSRLFEVVFPGDPGRAYLASRNSVQENALVVAHVLGHADFARNNFLFRRSHGQVGHRIVDQAAAHARRIDEAIEAHGQSRVESVLDAALALEQHIDVEKGLVRAPYPGFDLRRRPPESEGFRARFDRLPGHEPGEAGAPRRRTRVPLPPAPERDLLWFIATYAPDLDDWERDVFLAVREESFYFYPIFACHVMNEGWASYWHARLLRDADFLPQDQYLDAIKVHSDVVRPYAGDEQVALSINPYHLGFRMWEHIVEREGIDHARTIVEQDDDFGFIRNHLTEELADELGLFEYEQRHDGRVTVLGHDIDEIRQSLLAPKFNFGAPTVRVERVHTDGTLELCHDHETDGRGLDLERARKVLEYVHRVWRRPVTVHTVDARDREHVVSAGV